mmetsp:Transcript_2015/g.4433  ORF Transcript_2015/g.4433 Transcript_2015/m.4433 type:complete len:126 (+) Transcript_2015:1323-1700(+)
MHHFTSYSISRRFYPIDSPVNSWDAAFCMTRLCKQSMVRQFSFTTGPASLSIVFASIRSGALRLLARLLSALMLKWMHSISHMYEKGSGKKGDEKKSHLGFLLLKLITHVGKIASQLIQNNMRYG